METERWLKIEQLYHSALEREPSGRAAFVEQACGADESLRREVESLLAQARDTESFLEAPALDVAARDLAASAGKATHSHPAAMGRYRILRLLGEGGMGVVYEAEQEDPRRVVALKVIKLGLATPDRLRRFRQESQALARLQHPGIAQIYESNTADTGFGPQPYFAMEFIRGLPLKQYAEVHQLNTRQKLALMVKVCEAVHHAHQRGLIHRDLKPGNILVDETGQPKILDFGVARVIQADAEGSEEQPATQTGLGQIVGTLAYMSPEQVLGDPLEVDTRSDVYSLGVILYELLSGRPPYEVHHRKLPEAARTIREEEPASLSSISRNYRGDIETLVRKALEKDKARRYISAADLCADIQRYLNNEPLTARPPSAAYQLQKFARRHRGLMAGLAAVFVVLLAGVAVSTSMAVRASRAEAQARAVSEFLQNDLLAQASASTQARPNAKPDPHLEVRTALDRAAARIAGKFDRQPQVEAALRETIGTTYQDLGLYPEAQRQLERALDIYRRTLGEKRPETVTAMSNLGVLYAAESNYPQAEALLIKTLAIGERLWGKQATQTLELMNDLGDAYSRAGKYNQAESLLLGALEIRRRVSGEEHPATLALMSDLAAVYRLQGKYAQAEALYTKTLEARRRVSGEEHPETIDVMNGLGLALEYDAKYSQAEPLLAKTLELRRRVLGAEHPSTLSSMNDLALVYEEDGKYTEAEALFRPLLELQRRISGQENPATLTVMNNLGILYSFEDNFAMSEAMLSSTLEIRRRVLGPENDRTLVTLNNLALADLNLGRYADSEKLFSETLAIRRRVSGPEHPDTLLAMRNLANVYLSEGEYQKADTLLTSTLEAMQRVLGQEHDRTLTAMLNLGMAYTREGRLNEAETLLQKTVEIRRRVLGGEAPLTLRTEIELGRSQLLQRKYSEAETTFRHTLDVYRRTAPDDWRRFNCESLLGASLVGRKRFQEAEPLLLAGYQGLAARESRIGAPYKSDLADAREALAQLRSRQGQARESRREGEGVSLPAR